MFEEILNPTFLLYFATLAGAAGVIMFSLSRRTIETPVEILAVNGRKTKQVASKSQTENRELEKEVERLQEQVRELKIAQQLDPNGAKKNVKK